MTNMMRMMLAGVAFSALAVHGAWAQPVAGIGFGGLKLPGAGVLAVAVGEPAPDGSDSGAEDTGSDDAGTEEAGSGDPELSDPGPTPTDPAPGDEDGMAWTGGSPDFCEACGGEVIDGGEIAVDPGIEVDPGTEVTDEDGAVTEDGTDVTEDDGTVADDGSVLAGGGRDLCENCRDLTPPEVMYSTAGGVTGTPRAEASGNVGKAVAGHRDRSNDRTCRQRPMTGDCLH